MWMASTLDLFFETPIGGMGPKKKGKAFKRQLSAASFFGKAKGADSKESSPLSYSSLMLAGLQRCTLVAGSPKENQSELLSLLAFFYLLI